MENSTLYHVNDEGKVGVCRATVKKCKFADIADRHFASQDEAKAASEKMLSDRFAESGTTFVLPENFIPKERAGAINDFYDYLNKDLENTYPDAQIIFGVETSDPYAKLDYYDRVIVSYNIGHDGKKNFSETGVRKIVNKLNNAAKTPYGSYFSSKNFNLGDRLTVVFKLNHNYATKKPRKANVEKIVADFKSLNNDGIMSKEQYLERLTRMRNESGNNLDIVDYRAAIDEISKIETN